MFVGLHDGGVRLIEKFEDLSLEDGGEVDQTGVVWLYTLRHMNSRAHMEG
jgi:hypothetical protein